MEQAQRNGVFAQDSCSLNAGIEYDHVSNRLIGGDKTYRLGNLSNIFHLMAQQVIDTSTEENVEDEADAINKVSYFLVLFYSPYFVSFSL